jgi:hypothetical protein
MVSMGCSCVESWEWQAHRRRCLLGKGLLVSFSTGIAQLKGTSRAPTQAVTRVPWSYSLSAGLPRAIGRKLQQAWLLLQEHAWLLNLVDSGTPRCRGAGMPAAVLVGGLLMSFRRAVLEVLNTPPIESRGRGSIQPSRLCVRIRHRRRLV